MKSVKKSSVSYSEIDRGLPYGCGHHCDSALCLLACHSIAVTAAEDLAYRADACAYVFFFVFFVYSGAVFALPVPCPDPNRDPNAEKSGGFIRAGKDAAVKFSERKGSEML